MADSSTLTPPKPKVQKTEQGQDATAASKGATNDTSGKVPGASNISASHGADVTTQESRVSAVGGVDTGSTGNIAVIYRSRPLGTQTAYFTFEKHINFFSHAWAQNLLAIGAGNAARTYMSTDMCAIPTDLPFMYMSEQEFNYFSALNELYLVKVAVELTCFNGRTSFQANATNVTTVPKVINYG